MSTIIRITRPPGNNNEPEQVQEFDLDAPKQLQEAHDAIDLIANG